jgi:hypothetical protein
VYWAEAALVQYRDRGWLWWWREGLRAYVEKFHFFAGVNSNEDRVR